jgi:hypothetical protein
MRKSWIVTLLLLGAGCDAGGTDVVPAEVRAQRANAARDACIATELLRRADANLDVLEETLDATTAGPGIASITRQAAISAFEFGRTYHQHAQLRAGMLANLDSAYNHVQRSADSLRHVRTAEGYGIRPPAPGTVEANVVQSYQRDFATIHQNPDHPCNWE